MLQELADRPIRWDPDPSQSVAPAYDLAWSGPIRVVRVLNTVEPKQNDPTVRHYRPLDRLTLPEELARVAEADEHAALDFVQRNGFLDEERLVEPLFYIWRVARTARSVLALLNGLTEAKGDDRAAVIDKAIQTAIGDAGYEKLRHQSAGWVKASWREFQPPAGSADYPGAPPADERGHKLWLKYQVAMYGFATAPGGDPPARVTADDLGSPGATARFLIRDFLNVRFGVFDGALARPGAAAERRLHRDGRRLVTAMESRPLVNAIYWLLMDAASTQRRPVRLCLECGHFFVAYDKRQMFCGARDGEKESSCSRRRRMRRLRGRQTSSGLAGVASVEQPIKKSNSRKGTLT